MEMIRVTFEFPAGTSPQKMAFILRNHADIYDPIALALGEPGTVAVSNTRPTTTKKSKSETKRLETMKEETVSDDPFSDELVTETSDDGGFEDAFAEPPPKEKKTARPKKAKIEDVIAACKARADGGRYKEVVEILKTKFKVKSVHELTEEQWPVCIKAMA